MKKPSLIELKSKAFENAAALIESMDLEQLYGDFGVQFLDDDLFAEQMERMQNEVVFHLRNCGRR